MRLRPWYRLAAKSRWGADHSRGRCSCKGPNSLEAEAGGVHKACSGPRVQPFLPLVLALMLAAAVLPLVIVLMLAAAVSALVIVLMLAAAVFPVAVAAIVIRLG